MKLNRIYIAAFILGIGAVTTSCSSDFLDLSPKSNMNENDFYKTEEDFSTARTAAYATLYNEYSAQSGMSMSELMSDECTAYEGQVLVESPMSNSDAIQFVNYSLEPSNTIVKHTWQTAYADLNIINKTLDNLTASSEFAATATGLQYQAELRFLRALYNFNMVRLFGPIPLLDHSVTVAESYGILRSSEDDVYNLIISDLTFAVDNLPLKSAATQNGQITKGAAETCLGEVYLTRGDKSNAARVLKDVIDSGQYSLISNYADLWSLDNKNCAESIFEIQYIGAAGQPASPYFENYAPYENFAITAHGGGLNQVSTTLYNNYEANDPRRDASINTGYDTKTGTHVSALFENKWYDPVFINSGTYYYGNNFIVYRYADVLLMYAEATNDASYLNQVRSRVGLPGFGETGYPSDKYPTLDLAIEHERNVELAMEFHRWFDLKRTGRATTVLSTAKGKSVTDNMLVLPVPLEEIQHNNALTQNAYYSN